MKPNYLSFFASIVLAVLFCFGCTNADAPHSNLRQNDSVSIALGKTIFDQNCSGCHNFRQEGIGPNLAGVTDRDSTAWLMRFIKNPKALLDDGDSKAHGLLKKFATVMPSFASLKEDELQGLIAYLKMQKAPAQKSPHPDPLAIKNPIPEPIASSGLVAGLQLVAQIPFSGKEQPHTRICKLDVAPGQKNLFVLDQRGLLYKLVNHKPVVYLNIAKWKPHFINQPGLATGFGSFAFHPGFSRNGLFYTTHTEAAGSAKADFAYADSIKVAMQWVLTEWKTNSPTADSFSGTNRELMRINMVSGIHGMQEITFNPYAKNGSEAYALLYIGVGDGGSVENGYPFLAHNRNRVWGTILRIDPLGRNSLNGKYGIPPQNPFSTDPKTVKEIYAYGFRNPNRISWSRQGKMLTTNIGQANIEAVNSIVKGGDYGWPLREGSFALHPSGDINFVYALPSNDSAFTYPLAQYDHDEGKAISGGFVYTSTAIPQLKEKYLFGDIPTGRLFYVNARDLKLGKQAVIKEWNIAFQDKRTTMRALCGSDRVDLHFGKDGNGDIYLLTKPDGKIYKLVSATKTY